MSKKTKVNEEPAFEPTPNPHTQATPGGAEDMVPRAVMNEKLAAAERHHRAEMTIAANAVTAATARAQEAEGSLSTASEFEGKYNEAIAAHTKASADNALKATLAASGITDADHVAVLMARYQGLEAEGRAELSDWMTADPIAQMVLGVATGKKAAPLAPNVNNGTNDTKGQPKDMTLTNTAIRDMSIEELKANREAILSGSFEVSEPPAP